MTTSANRPIRKKRHLTILQRVAEGDKTAVQDCLDTYGNFIWALAKKFTASMKDTETAAQAIFTDIWHYAEHIDKTPTVEKKLIAMIALRRLIKQLKPTNTNL